jgi:GT2 family glycosyltransferase
MATPFSKAISVVVLNFNRAETTISCVEHVWKSSGNLVREIIVVDNGSRDSEVRTLEAGISGRARLLELGTNRYFGEGNNLGVEAATGDFVLLLNNDAFVEPDCIARLAATWQADDTVAAVGPMFVYPDGRVQEVGSVVLETGDIVQVGKGSVWTPSHYTDVCTVDYCSAACLLLRREDFLAVGGFGLEWEPAYYEDADLCLKLWANIGRVVVDPRATVVHLESHTTADPTLALNTVVNINRLKFVDKWGNWIREKKGLYSYGSEEGTVGLSPEPRDDLLHIEPPPSKASRTERQDPSVVVYEPYELVPGGGERKIFEVAAYFSSERGHDQVALATPFPYSETRMTQLTQLFGHEPPIGHPYALDQIDQARVDVAVVLGNQIVPPVAPFGRVSISICQFPFATWPEYIERNAPFLADYDEIWVNSNFTRRYVNGLTQLLQIPRPPIRIVNPPATLATTVPPLEWTERRTLLAVGRFFKGDHDKRHDIALMAAGELARRIGKPVEIAIAGSLHSIAQSRERFEELRTLAADLEGVSASFYPNASHQRLAELYARSSVLIHATGYGIDGDAFPERLEHFGITPVEAASMGCIPVTVSQGGPAEVLAALDCPTTFSTVEECVDIVERLWEDPGGSTKLSARLVSDSQRYSPQVFHARVKQAMDALA